MSASDPSGLSWGVEAPVTPLVQEDDAALTARLASGDGEALQELHRRYAPLVFHLACKSLDRAAAEEITQEVFLAVWRKAGSHDPERGTVRTWLLSITHHRILDELRARTRRPGTAGFQALDSLELSAQDPLPDEALWREYQRRTIAEALEALPAAQRAALRLAYFGELSQEMVAEALAIPLGTAKTRIRSGLRALFSRLGGLVAGLLLVVSLPGLWLLRQAAKSAQRTSRALDLLANSQLTILKLFPPGAAEPGEGGLHAGFRSIPGRDLAVLTLSHFPAPPPGRHYLLWVRRPEGLAAMALPDPDRDGKALQILEGAPLGGPWPTELLITAEAGQPSSPEGAAVVRWAQGTPPR